MGQATVKSYWECGRCRYQSPQWDDPVRGWFWPSRLLSKTCPRCNFPMDAKEVLPGVQLWAAPELVDSCEDEVAN